METTNKSSSLEGLNLLWDAETMLLNGEFDVKEVAALIGRGRVNLGGYSHSEGEHKAGTRILSMEAATKIADIFEKDQFQYWGAADILRTINYELLRGYEEKERIIGDETMTYYEIPEDDIHRLSGMLNVAFNLIDKLTSNFSERLWWYDLKDYEEFRKQIKQQVEESMRKDNLKLIKQDKNKDK